MEKWSDLGGAEKPLRLALTYVDGPFGCSESAQKVSCAFLKSYAAAATGTSNVRAALQAHAVPDLSKRASKLFAAPAAEKSPALLESTDSKNSGSNNNENSTSVSSTGSPRGNPLKALREAQVYALFGDALDGAKTKKDADEDEGLQDDASWVSAAAWGAKPMQRLSGGDREEFLQQTLLWVVTHRTELAEPARVTACLNFFDEMRSIEVMDGGIPVRRREGTRRRSTRLLGYNQNNSKFCVHALKVKNRIPHRVTLACLSCLTRLSALPQGPSYSPAGRTPKSVLAALEAYELSTIQFDDDDEEFQPNPCNIAGFFKQQATIPVSLRIKYRKKCLSLAYRDLHSISVLSFTAISNSFKPRAGGHRSVRAL